MSDEAFLPDALLERLLEEVREPSIHAVALTGSFARGDATRYSDVDLIRYAGELPELAEERYTLRYREGHLVSIDTTTIEDKQGQLRRPQDAIFAVAGLLQSRILFDANSTLAELLAEAADFSWEPLRPAAVSYVAEMVMGNAEEAHKVLGSLLRRDESAILYTALGMLSGLTRAVAVYHGVLVESENSYYRQVQEAAGLASAWTRHHRSLAGFDPLPPALTPYEARAATALRLYVETARMVDDVFQPAHREVVEATVAAIAESDVVTDDQ